MRKRDVQKLQHGVYAIYWRGGGASYAAVGSLADGTRWMAAANWTGIGSGAVASTSQWHRVERVILLKAN